MTGEVQRLKAEQGAQESTGTGKGGENYRFMGNRVGGNATEEDLNVTTTWGWAHTCNPSTKEAECCKFKAGAT